jgi:hypothetical protein
MNKNRQYCLCINAVIDFMNISCDCKLQCPYSQPSLYTKIEAARFDKIRVQDDKVGDYQMNEYPEQHLILLVGSVNTRRTPFCIAESFEVLPFF